MTKFERIIRLPAMLIPRTAAERIAADMHELAEKRVTAELEQRLRASFWDATPKQVTVVDGQQFPPPPAWLPANVETFVEQNINSNAWRNLVRPSFGDKYTFLSPSGNVQFLFDDFSYEDIPPDVDLLLAEAGGPNGEILALHVKARPQALDANDPNQNRILIQGPSRAWVNDTCDRLKIIVSCSKEPFRHLAYHWMPAFVWLTFLVGVILEYKLARLVVGFTWSQPLNGLQLLFAFALLAFTLMASSLLFQRTLPYLFPYFQLEGKLSQARAAWRKPVLAAIGVLYAAAITALFAVR